VTARREYGSGSLAEVRPGTYRLRWHTGIDPFTGKRTQRQETFHGTRKAATKRLAECIAAADVSSSMTLGALLDMHAAQAQLGADTKARYDYALRHLPAGVRAWRLDEISSPMIAELYRRLEADGVGAQTIHKVRTALSSAFRYGIEWGVVDRNPCRGVRPPAIERRTYVIPTVDHLRAMLDQADTKPGAFPIWLRLALGTGGRRIEVLRLRWADVTFVDGLAKLRVVTAKTRGQRARTVVLDANTSAALLAWRALAAERAIAVGAELEGDCYVVSDDPASRVPWRPELATKRLQRLSTAVGCPGARLHDLRHAHATMLIEAGVSMRTVADRLGHTRVSTTQDIYGHLLPGADEGAAATFGQLMGG